MVANTPSLEARTRSVPISDNPRVLVAQLASPTVRCVSIRTEAPFPEAHMALRNTDHLPHSTLPNASTAHPAHCGPGVADSDPFTQSHVRTYISRLASPLHYATRRAENSPPTLMRSPPEYLRRWLEQIGSRSTGPFFLLAIFPAALDRLPTPILFSSSPRHDLRLLSCDYVQERSRVRGAVSATTLRAPRLAARGRRRVVLPDI